MKVLFYCLILFFTLASFQEQESMIIKATSYNIKGRTASGVLTSKIKEPFLAMSRDLIDDFPIGSYVVLSNCKWAGKYKVMDKMGQRHTKMVDIYSPLKRTGIVKCECSLNAK